MDLIENILPPRRVHLLGGVSDAGKTRFIIPALLDFTAGRPILGQPTHPCPWVYVSGDRSAEELEDTLYAMDIPKDSFPYIPAFGKDNKNLRQIIEAATNRPCKPELLIIEGFADLCPVDTRKEVRAFLSSCSAYCQPSRTLLNGLTILGIVESPKLKPNERYRNPRQRISGVSSWAYHTSTVLLIENIDKDDTYESEERILWACMKNSRRLKLAAKFDARGCLRCL